jgi:hypothetical protein
VAGAAVVAVIVLSFAPFIPEGGLRELYDRTLGYQLDRGSPFSIWGQDAGLDGVWTAVKVLAVVLAAGVAFVPRRKSAVQVAALGAAVLIAFQLTASHWFYLYIVWFTPFVLVALFALHFREGEGDRPALRPEAEKQSAAAEPALA